MKKLVFLVLVICSTLTGCTTTSTVNQSTSPSSGPFDFSKYLPFTPLLPTYTDGYQFSYSYIVRNLDPKHGDVIQYWAEYGNPRGTSIQVEEARPEVFRLVSLPSPGYYAHITKDNVEYVVMSQGAAASLSQLEKVAQSIGKPATVKPDEINMWDTGTQSQNDVDFKIVKRGTFYLPQGVRFTAQLCTISIQQTTRTETYSMTYDHALQIDQTKRFGSWNGPQNNGFVGNVEMIDGVKVTFDQPVVGNESDGAAFTNPQTAVEFVIRNEGLPNFEFRRVLNSIVKASLSQ